MHDHVSKFRLFEKTFRYCLIQYRFYALMIGLLERKQIKLKYTSYSSITLLVTYFCNYYFFNICNENKLYGIGLRNFNSISITKLDIYPIALTLQLSLISLKMTSSHLQFCGAPFKRQNERLSVYHIAND